MADALISPAVGGTMWVATAGLTAYCAAKLEQEIDERKTALMGVLGASIFAAQMVNFAIPGTGSSGHLGGGILLAILLGPYAAFLTMASILTVQALFFADGGLLALGCNIFNLGFFPCFVAYPFIYKKIAADNRERRRTLAAAMAASVVGLQLGSLGVVAETVFSNISDLSPGSFILWMQPIHLAIGIVEGLVTASIVGFVNRARPELLDTAFTLPGKQGISLKPVLVVLILTAVLTGGVLSRFASTNPDGLEWSVAGISGDKELHGAESRIHDLLSGVQKKMALLPDYNFREDKTDGSAVLRDAPGKAAARPSPGTGASVSGLLGGAMTLVLAGLIGFGIKICRRSPGRTQADGD